MGLRRSLYPAGVAFAVLAGVACGKHHHDGGVDADGTGQMDACESGLQCFQVDCSVKGLPPTSLSGTVYAPNGTLPLYGVNVYVPQLDPGPFADGAQCGRCDAIQPGSPLVLTTTDEAGHFQLDNVPATGDVPLIITSGKWRREIKIANVAACQNLDLPTVETTFPKSRTDLTPNTIRVDLPKIAISTGGSDALECLIRKLGIADTEFTTDVDPSPGRVNLFHGNGRASFNANPAMWTGGQGTLSESPTLWGTTDKAAALAKLMGYDIVMLSCEGGQGPGNKSQQALDAVHDYAGLGGRVFASHWHNIWISGDQTDATHGEPDWEAVGKWDFGAAQPAEGGTSIATIDETVPKGMSFATWMVNVGGSTVNGTVMRDSIFEVNPRFTLASNDTTKSDRRVFATATQPKTTVPPAEDPDYRTYDSVQDLEFTTPLDQPPENRCGKVVFSDMHVASGSTPNGGGAFPDGCATGDLSAQEKALAFIFFDISSCVGPISKSH